jgi:LPXTG-motif cell wall-anchored protein
MNGWLLWGLVLPVLLVIAGVITLRRRKSRR